MECFRPSCSLLELLARATSAVSRARRAVARHCGYDILGHSKCPAGVTTALSLLSNSSHELSPGANHPHLAVLLSCSSKSHAVDTGIRQECDYRQKERKERAWSAGSRAQWDKFLKCDLRDLLSYAISRLERVVIKQELETKTKTCDQPPDMMFLVG
jgi:hypothetical protein